MLSIISLHFRVETRSRERSGDKAGRLGCCDGITKNEYRPETGGAREWQGARGR